MNNNFNVTQFAELQARATQIFNSTIENIRGVQRVCAEISGIVASEDSGLSGSWSNVSQTLNEPINSSSMIFDGINSAMTNYAVEVVANEEKEVHNLEEYNNSISSLAASAMALSDSINNTGTLSENPSVSSRDDYVSSLPRTDTINESGDHYHMNMMTGENEYVDSHHFGIN